MKLDKHLQNISEIRSLMEHSARFLSLSGISGIAVGTVGLLAAGFVKWYTSQHAVNIFSPTFKLTQETELVRVLILAATGTLILALGLAVFFTTRMARQKKQPVWSPSAKHLLTHLSVPLLVGGMFCLLLLKYDLLYLIAPAMLIFYGMALLNASKFTIREVAILGYVQIALGLLAGIWPLYGLWFWAFGFGVVHILNGVFMYFRYEA